MIGGSEKKEGKGIEEVKSKKEIEMEEGKINLLRMIGEEIGRGV